MIKLTTIKVFLSNAVVTVMW